MIKVILADDQQVVRQGLQLILESDPDISIIASAGDGNEACDKVDEITPDIVLMDLNMPVCNGVTATRRIKQKHPRLPVIILTTYSSDEWLFDALRAGADGYLLKDIDGDELIKAVKGSLEGKRFLDPSITGRVLKGFACIGTPAQLDINTDLFNLKEREILACLTKGYSNQEIADSVHLASGTVRNYISQIFTKLGVQDRTQAAIIAARSGLVDTDS